MTIENSNKETDIKQTENKVFTSITETILDSVPSVSEHVIQAENGQLNKPINELGINSINKPPEDQNIFNPDIHATDEDGNPIITKSGKYRKKAGRKKSDSVNKDQNFHVNDSTIGNTNTEQVLSQPNTQPETVVNTEPENVLNGDAKVLSQVGSLGCSRIRDLMGGGTANKDELEYLESAFYNWSTETGVAISPTAGLAMAVTVFMLPVVQAPKEKNIITKVKRWIKKLWFKKNIIPLEKDETVSA